MDYLHYNPVKHNLVQSPFEWKYSTLRAYRRDGYYDDDWGIKESFGFEGEFGD